MMMKRQKGTLEEHGDDSDETRRDGNERLTWRWTGRDRLAGAAGRQRRNINYQMLQVERPRSDRALLHPSSTKPIQ